MESIEDGTVTQEVKEDELVFYIEVGNWEGLAMAKKKEHHEQWEIKIEQEESSDFKKRFRVRKTTTADSNARYTFTIKTKQTNNSEVSGNKERNTTVDENLFNEFKYLSHKGMIKDRFFFDASCITVKYGDKVIEIPPETVELEVDLFPTKDNPLSHHPWGKVDIEVDNLMAYLKQIGITNEVTLFVNLQNMPLEPKTILNSAKESDKAAIDKLYDDYFITKH